MAAVDDRVEIIDRILANEIKKSEVEAALVDLESEFGEEAYADDGFCPKEKPWNKDYYLELEKVSLTGVSSKRYILHLVEVRDYLKAKLLVIMGGVLAVVIAIVGIIIALCC